MRIQSLLCILLLTAGARAQMEFRVEDLTGVAKVQHPGKQEWNQLKRGCPISSGDIVETFFKTRIVLDLKKRLIVIGGSNSKFLLEVSEKKRPEGIVAEVSLNLLSGGVFVQSAPGTRVRIFTSSATVTLESGALSTILDKNGETGVQVLQGDVDAGNITSRQKQTITAGQSILVYPGRDPLPSVPISQRHVSVLKHYFGDEYISQQLHSSGIAPVEDRTRGASRPEATKAKASAAAPTADPGIYKRPFSLEKIYGAILADNERENPQYLPILPPRTASPGRMELATGAGSFFTSTAGFPWVELRPSLSTEPFDIGLRLSLISNAREFGLHQFSASRAGYADLIDHARFALSDKTNNTGLRINAGALEQFSFGQELLVRNFSNRNPYSQFQALGIDAHVYAGNWTLSGFVSDPTLMDLSGTYLSWEPGVYHFGAGYYYDSGRFTSTDHPRYSRFSAGDSSGTTRGYGPARSMYEVGLGVDLASDPFRFVQAQIGFAHELSADSAVFLARIPGLRIQLKGMDFGGAMIIEQGRMSYPQFHALYPVSRMRFDTTGSTARMQGESAPRTRNAAGLDLFYRIRTPENLAVEAHYYQQFTSFFFITAVDSSDTGAVRTFRRTRSHPRTYDYRLAATMGEGILPLIQYARVHMGQVLGGVYPPGSGNPGWGFSAGAQAITRPLMGGPALESRVRLEYLDLSFAPGTPRLERPVSPDTDRVIHFYAGIRWGFF